MQLFFSKHTNDVLFIEFMGRLNYYHFDRDKMHRTECVIKSFQPTQIFVGDVLRIEQVTICLHSVRTLERIITQFSTRYRRKSMKEK